MCRNSGCNCKEERENSSQRGKEMLKARREKRRLAHNKQTWGESRHEFRKNMLWGLGLPGEMVFKILGENDLRPKNPTCPPVSHIPTLAKSWSNFTQITICGFIFS